MNDERLQTIEQVRQFLEGSEAVEFRGLTAKEKYYWIEEVLITFLGVLGSFRLVIGLRVI